jgi:hypothetical protein
MGADPRPPRQARQRNAATAAWTDRKGARVLAHRKSTRTFEVPMRLTTERTVGNHHCTPDVDTSSGAILVGNFGDAGLIMAFDNAPGKFIDHLRSLSATARAWATATRFTPQRIQKTKWTACLDRYAYPSDYVQHIDKMTLLMGLNDLFV